MSMSPRMKENVASAIQKTEQMHLTELMQLLPILNHMKKPIREVFINAMIEKSAALAMSNSLPLLRQG
jgi:hypothetical protein